MDSLTDALKLEFKKTAYTSAFSLRIFVGKSVCWYLFGVSKLRIFFNIFSLSTSENELGLPCVPTNTSRVFHVEMKWKRPFPRRFNLKCTWCVCRGLSLHTSPIGSVFGWFYFKINFFKWIRSIFIPGIFINVFTNFKISCNVKKERIPSLRYIIVFWNDFIISNVIHSLETILSERKSLSVLLLFTFFSARHTKYYFLFFCKSETQWFWDIFFVYLFSVLSFKNPFRSFPVDILIL